MKLQLRRVGEEGPTTFGAVFKFNGKGFYLVCLRPYAWQQEWIHARTHISYSHTHLIPPIPNQPWDTIITVLYFNCVARSHRIDFRKASVRRKSIFFSFSFNALSVTLSEREVNQSAHWVLYDWNVVQPSWQGGTSSFRWGISRGWFPTLINSVHSSKC